MRLQIRNAGPWLGRRRHSRCEYREAVVVGLEVCKETSRWLEWTEWRHPHSHSCSCRPHAIADCVSELIHARELGRRRIEDSIVRRVSRGSIVVNYSSAIKVRWRLHGHNRQDGIVHVIVIGQHRNETTHLKRRGRHIVDRDRRRRRRIDIKILVREIEEDVADGGHADASMHRGNSRHGDLMRTIIWHSGGQNYRKRLAPVCGEMNVHLSHTNRSEIGVCHVPHERLSSARSPRLFAVWISHHKWSGRRAHVDLHRIVFDAASTRPVITRCHTESHTASCSRQQLAIGRHIAQ
jgi:hypothetical protein